MSPVIMARGMKMIAEGMLKATIVTSANREEIMDVETAP
jgi:hypothetical protein